MKNHCFLILFLIAGVGFLKAQWNPSPAVNNLVCSQPNDQQDLRMISDGRGGAIITWIDFRNDPNIPGVSADIFAQRIDANGTVQWTTNGVAVCTDNADQTAPVITTDGQKGAIIAWQDWRNGNRDIYAQRLDSSGNVAWNTNGVPVAVKNGHQQSPRIATDNSGGAVITWEDSVNGNWDIYAQRINSTGTALWNSNGIAVCLSNMNQINPKIVTDINANAFITWQDERNGNDYDIYVQMLNGTGVAQWTGNGLALATGANTQTNPKIALDFGGMIIVSWQNQMFNTSYDIYAQRISTSGIIQWASNGVIICNAPGSQSAIDMTTENITDGALICWKDARAANVHIYCQKVNFSGISQWTANGVLLSNPARVQVNPNIVSDGYGGGIVAWQDSISGIWDVYSQRITSAGVITWAAGGIPVGIATNNQTSVKNISDGLGGSIYAFQDRRSGDFDIYAYKLDWSGTVAMISEDQMNNPAMNVYPNPNNGNFFIELNTADAAQVIVYDAFGQVVSAQEVKPETQQALCIETSGAYLVSVITKEGTRTSQRVIVTR